MLKRGKGRLASRRLLLALTDNEAGQELLKRIGVQQFDTSSESRMRELLKWLSV